MFWSYQKSTVFQGFSYCSEVWARGRLKAFGSSKLGNLMQSNWTAILNGLKKYYEEISCVSCVNFAVFAQIFTKFSPIKKFGMIKSILGSFCIFLNWEGANIWPQIRPRKITCIYHRQVNELAHEILILLTYV